MAKWEKAKENIKEVNSLDRQLLSLINRSAESIGYHSAQKDFYRRLMEHVEKEELICLQKLLLKKITKLEKRLQGMNLENRKYLKEKLDEFIDTAKAAAQVHCKEATRLCDKNQRSITYSIFETINFNIPDNMQLCSKVTESGNK